MGEDIKSPQSIDYKTTYLDSFKKLRFFKHLELKPGILGCFLFTMFLISSVFLLDFKSLNGLRLQSFLTWCKSSVSTPKPAFVEEGFGFLEKRRDCNLFDGKWVWDESYPLYQSEECMFLDGGFRCTESGRPDTLYAKWRWQPKDCNLPRFDAKAMLAKLRNKRLVFVGDSIGRNQWESFLCMLSSAIQNKTSIYEVNRSPITKHSGSLIIKFQDFNCTVEYYRAPFLVLQSRAPARASSKIRMTLKLDQMDWSAEKWKDADLLILNTGHWWNYEKTIKVGCYFQEGAEIKMEMPVENALQRSMQTLMDWITLKVNTTKTHLIFRTYAPVHFSSGDWKNGGGCNSETIPDTSIKTSLISSETYTEYKAVIDAFSKHPETRNITILDVTRMSSSRKDGHPSLYYYGPGMGQSPLNRQDCSHWCLPGVPDSWNELLYALFLKREISHA